MWCRSLHSLRTRRTFVSNKRDRSKRTKVYRLTCALPDRVRGKPCIEAYDVEPGTPQDEEERDVRPECVAVRYSVILCKDCEVCYRRLRLIDIPKNAELTYQQTKDRRKARWWRLHVEVRSIWLLRSSHSWAMETMELLPPLSRFRACLLSGTL